MEKKIAGTEKPNYVRKVKMGYGSLQYFFLVKHLDDPILLNIQFRLPLNGTIRISDLGNAVQKLGRRHEALRTAFFVDTEDDDEPTQGILETSPLRLETVKITDLDDARRIGERLTGYVFDIESGQTIRILLLSMSPDCAQAGALFPPYQYRWLQLQYSA